ncbi:MAG: hypothetical protein V4484_15225 [Pseudomonadota bacterium]
MTLLKKCLRATACWFGLLMITLAAWMAWTYAFLPKHASTTSLWHAAEAFEQCTREAPPADSYWIPTRVQVREAEAALLLMFAERKRLRLTMPAESGAEQPFRYHHQYSGFARNGEHMIYLNAFPVYDNDEINYRPFALLETIECVADGGRYFWSAVYHVRLKAFEAPQFNGPA